MRDIKNYLNSNGKIKAKINNSQKKAFFCLKNLIQQFPFSADTRENTAGPKVNVGGAWRMWLVLILVYKWGWKNRLENFLCE